MTMILKQSTAVDVLIGPFLDITDGATAETGESPSVKLSKNGQTLAAKNDVTTPVSDADGYYNCELDATDTNTVGTMTLTVAASATALPVRHEFQVLEEDIYDALYGASAAGFNASAQVAVGSIAANAITATAIAANAITAAKIATDAITSAKIAADAIGASELATDAVEEIADQVWDEVLTGATHNVVNSAGRRLRNLQEFGGYSGGMIYIDTVNGTAGTTDFENGVDSNPVDNIADANTLAASVGISKFMIAPGSTITFAATQQNQVFTGNSWTLAFGGQNIDGSTVIGANVSGIAVNTAGEQYLIDCDLGAVTLPSDTHAIGCAISGTQTAGEAGDYFYDNCHSSVAGTGTPAFDFGGALNASNLSFRHYSGGIEIQNMGAGTGSYNMSLEGDGQLVINANCSATSTVAIRGNFTVTDNAGGAVTLSDDARIDTGQINAQADLALTDIGLDHLVSAAVVGADVTDNSIMARLVSSSVTADWDDFVNTTDSLQALRDRGDAAWTTGAGGTPPHLLQNTTIATLASQTSFTLTAGSADDDAYNGAIVVVTDSVTAVQKAVATVSDYVGSTRTVTLAADPAIYTMAVGDTIDIMAALGSAGNAPTAGEVADAVWDEAQAAHTTAGTFGEMATETSAILVDTGTTIPAQISGLNDLSAAQVNAECDTAIADAALATAAALATVDANVDAVLLDTGITIPAQISGLNDLSAAQVNAECDTAIADASLATAAALATVDANVDAVLTDTGTTIPAQITALNDLSAAQVNAEVLDVLNTDTFAEPTGVPSTTASIVNKLGHLQMALVNQVTVTATKKTFHDSGNTAEFEKDLSDDGTTYTETAANAP